MKKILLSALSCICIVCLVVLSLSGGKKAPETGDLMSDIQSPPPAIDTTLLSEYTDEYNSFSLRLMALCLEDTSANPLISPCSLISALAMTANGAGGETLAQMENTLGISLNVLNPFMYTYTNKLYKEYDTLNLSNSLWIVPYADFSPKTDFLQANADWHNAQIFCLSSNESPSDRMNTWITENTGGLLPAPVSLHQGIDVLYLISTAFFNAEWESSYYDSDVESGVFTCADGSEAYADFMYSRESIYFEDEYGTGFLKPYTTDEYLFAALLPREGIPLAEYITMLDGSSLISLLSSSQYAAVYTSIPKFSAGYALDGKSRLSQMGLVDAFFQGKADFSLMGDNAQKLYIGSVYHNTHIVIDEIGTRAAAVTAIPMRPASELEPGEEKYVYLDRPFLYMILDSDTLTPVFLGAVNTLA